MLNPHQIAITQLKDIAEIIKKQYKDEARFSAAIEKLSTPDRVLESMLEITMDDGSTKSFQAYRSQHNNARGPYKGGIRFHHGVTKEEVMALSTWMTWKCAVTGIPYGGGKGGIIVDPATLSEAELQRLSRAYARFLGDNVGPWKDIPAPDVNTTGQIMAWMVDEIEKRNLEAGNGNQENPLATFTGKPLTLGGSEGREEATGLGGVYVLEELAAELKWHDKSKVTVAIQGFGNVGYWFAQHAHERGYLVIAVSDSKGALYVPTGLNPEATLLAKQAGTSLKQQAQTIPGAQFITNEAVLELDATVLVPSALENVIHAANADRIKAQAIIEMANGPTTPEADAIFAKKGIVVIPDVLANAGGVTTSYFEWVQNLQGYYWTHDEVLAKLQPLMAQAFKQMWEIKEDEKLDGRMATYFFAVKRVIDAMMLRGRV